MEEEKNQPSSTSKLDISEDENEELHEYESDSSSDGEGSEKCPICLLKLTNDQEIGKPEICDHIFCFPCIEEWSKVMRTCPIDRKEFSKIKVFDNVENNHLLRTVEVGEQISVKDYTAGEIEYTQCEICRSSEREDVMLLCDGCDKGFHMDCLNPPLQYVPLGDWYCQHCEENGDFSSSDEEEEEEDLSFDEEADAAEAQGLQNEIETELGGLPATRLRVRLHQPQIVRTLQSERIRNAILARRSLRGVMNDVILPSTSMSAPTTSRAITNRAKRKSPKKRRKSRRKTTSEVVEYEIKNGVKFPIKVKKRVVRRKTKKRKTRKRKVAKRKSTGSAFSKGASNSTQSFRNANSNVYELQRGRQLAGLNNFNIFQPANQLDYIPDDEIFEVDENIGNNSESVLTQGIINYINPNRRQAIIKKRVIDNFITTSSSCDLLDSILNEKSFYGNLSNKKVNLNDQKNIKVKKSTTDDNSSTSYQNQGNSKNDDRQTENINPQSTSQSENLSYPGMSEDDKQYETMQETSPTCNIDSKKQKKKKHSFDMFQETTPEHEEEEKGESGGCPNFSIYDDPSTPPPTAPQINIDSSIIDENVDLVQMSDEEKQNQSTEFEEEEVIVKSQPASPDLENDNEQRNEERSYTPPLNTPSQQPEIITQELKEDENSSNKKNKKSKDKKSKRQEMERYNVREKVRERSPVRLKDQFGRNRTRSRSNSPRNKRKRSKSRNRNRSKSKSYESRRHRHRHRSRSKSISRKRERDSSEDRRRKKNKRRKSKSRTRSRSPSPRFNYSRREDKSPRRKRRDRSPSEKPKKKKHRSKEKTSTTTKEVYTSGQNILVSVNFSSNQDDKRSTKSTSHDDNEPIVDITAKKKINVSSKPVAIIDLARSPFKELTPDYKKESNVIELSDSEGEKHQKIPNSPDSTKFYDPFDILNSPTNENVSSSQQNVKKAIKLDATIKGTTVQLPTLAKNQQAAVNSNNEENIVTSSSSVKAIFPPRSSGNKIEVLQHEIIQNPNMDMSIESPYSPGGNDDTYHDDAMQSSFKTKAAVKANIVEKPTNIFDDLFGSSSPPCLDMAKSSSKKTSDPTHKYINKLKRQERVIEEVKTAIKPHYSKRVIDKEQYKLIMKKAVPKICHNKSGEINPMKIKHLIDSYVKFYSHKKKRKEIAETI